MFRDRFELLRQERDLSNTDFAKFLEMSRQTVGFYLNGERVPDALTLIKIAEKCNVSSDYLIGLTDIRSPDLNIQAVSKETGLSEKCLEALRIIHGVDISAEKAGKVKYEYSETINCLVEHEPDFNPLVWIGRYLSVPDIKINHYITVNGEIKKKSERAPRNKDEFVEISRSAIESAFLQQVTAELMMLKMKLNSDETVQELQTYAEENK